MQDEDATSVASDGSDSTITQEKFNASVGYDHRPPRNEEPKVFPVYEDYFEIAFGQYFPGRVESHLHVPGSVDNRPELDLEAELLLLDCQAICDDLEETHARIKGGIAAIKDGIEEVGEGIRRITLAAGMAATAQQSPAHQATKNGTAEDGQSESPGPHPGRVKLNEQYIFEKAIRRQLKEKGSDPAREDTNRLDGIALIGDLREALQLPIRTFDTACTFYHIFRLTIRESQYSFRDAAIACLFFACKAEDTLKKSKEILCADHNLQHPSDARTPDDKIFEKKSSVIITLERQVVESIAFDFRVRHPQKVIAKMIKATLPEDHGAQFFEAVWKMSLDMYLTFVPIKQTTFTMAFAVIELSSRLTGMYTNELGAQRPDDWHTTRECVVETMLDLLDLYTENGKLTKIGALVDSAKFIETKIALNKELDEAKMPRFGNHCHRCETDPVVPEPASPATPAGRSSAKSSGSGESGGTNRFVFDADEARREEEIVQQYLKDEYDEVEVEVDEEIRPADRGGRPREPHRGGLGAPPHGPSSHGHGHGGRDPGWYGGRGGRPDRRRSRGGFR